MINVIKAIQEIYPDIKGGFAYWETKQDGSPLNNPIDGLKWENLEHEKPSWDEIESKLGDIDLQEAKDSKITELKANKLAADLQDHHHEINGSWYAFHMDLESRNLLSSILSSATTIYGYDPLNTEDDNKVVYSSFGANTYDKTTKETGEKSFINLTYKDLRELYRHIAVRLGSIYALYNLAKNEINALTDINEVKSFDTNISYEAE